MRRKKISGICHICGNNGELSFEHIPPQSAFNNQRTISFQGEHAIKLGPDEIAKGPISQGGIGDHTLCGRCNNGIGHWYGKYFVDWCYQAMRILINSDGNPHVIHLNYISPLAILKQITAMFFSVIPPEFAQKNQELVKFVLDRNLKYLSPKYRFFMYYNIGNKFRYVGGGAVILKLENRERINICEISYPPFGYVMTLSSNPPDNRLCDITFFSRYDYGDFEIIDLDLQVLPTHLAYPGDYRSKKEIDENRKQNEEMRKEVLRGNKLTPKEI